MSSGIRRGNLFDSGEVPLRGERFDELGQIAGVRIERILSSDHPESGEYDQAHDEWVLLVRGAAQLELEGERLELRAGDYVHIPAHARHRVLATTPGVLWLALHATRCAG